MIANVVAVRVGDEGEGFGVPRIQPQALARQLEPAMESDGNQEEILNPPNVLVQRRPVADFILRPAPRIDSRRPTRLNFRP